jgi:hypothetical protein
LVSNLKIWSMAPLSTGSTCNYRIQLQYFDKFKKLTLVLMCRFIHYISAIWFYSCIKCKMVTICICLTSIICFHAYLVKRHAYVSDLCNEQFYCLWYIHTARQMKIQPPKIEHNLSAKMSTLKSRNSKTSPMSPYFL